MSINLVTPRNQYTATASQTVFTYSFEIFEDSDIVVDQDGVILTLTTHYTVTGAGNDAGGTIVLVTGATAGDIITLYRDVPTERVTDFQTSGDFLAATVNTEFDRIIAMIQENEETASRALQLPINDSSGASVGIATPAAGEYLKWSDDGTVLETATLADLGVIAEENITHLVENVTGLTALDTGSQVYAQTAGYTTAGDGGGAFYYYDSSSAETADDFIYIDPDVGTGQWVLNTSSRLVHIKQAGGVGDGVADDTTAVQNFFLALADSGLVGVLDDGTYLCDGTIAPAGKFHIVSSGANIQFSTAGTYEDVPRINGSDSGVDVAFDVSGTFGSVINGTLTISTNATWTNTNTNTIPGTLAAFATTDTTSGNGWTVDDLTIQRFGYGLFQSDQSLGGTAQLPFTRNIYQRLFIFNCGYPFWFGNSGNGFDDAFIGTLRVSRCRFASRIKATELNCGSAFFFGLNSSDAEAITASTTASSTAVTLSAAGSVANNDWLVIAGAGPSGLDFVAKVASGGGTTSLVMDRNAGTTTATKTVWRNPPGACDVANGGLIANHLYLEGRFNRPIYPSGFSQIISQDFKVSGGEFSSARSCAILFDDVYDSCEITLNGSTTPLLERIVYLSAVKNGSSIRGKRRVIIKAAGNITINSMKMGQPHTLLAGYTDESVGDTTFARSDDLIEYYVGGSKRIVGPSTAGHDALEMHEPLIRATVGQSFFSKDGSFSATTATAVTVLAAGTMPVNAMFWIQGQFSNLTWAVAYVITSNTGVPVVNNIASTAGAWSVDGSNNLQYTNSTGTTRTVTYSVRYEINTSTNPPLI